MEKNFTVSRKPSFINVSRDFEISPMKYEDFAIPAAMRKNPMASGSISTTFITGLARNTNPAIIIPQFMLFSFRLFFSFLRLFIVLFLFASHSVRFFKSQSYGFFTVFLLALLDFVHLRVDFVNQLEA